MSIKKMNAVVSAKIELTPELMILKVTPEGWDLPDYVSGQFTVLGLPGSAQRSQFSDPDVETRNPDKLIKRAYSVASASINKDYVEFYITLVRSGSLTPRLFNLKVGDRVFMAPKFGGMFTMDEVPQDQNIILLGTGTGLAPYMSMLRSGIQCNSGRNIIVAHGARHSWDLGYRSELNTLQSVCSNFSYHPTITSPDEEHTEWRGNSGYLQDLWKDGVFTKKFEATAENTHIFLCGNPNMVEGMVELLEKDGFAEHSKKSPGQIHVERYW